MKPTRTLLLNHLRIICLIACVLSLNACVTPPSSNSVDQRFGEINENLARLEDSLNASITEVCTNNQQELREQLQAAELRATKAVKEQRAAARKCKAQPSIKSEDVKVVNDKLLLGGVENLKLIDEDLTFEARVDTGAETSSLGVYKLMKFERDGKDWVKFKLKNLKKAPTYEYRVSNDVRIKQRGDGGGDQRYQIKMDVAVGKKTYRKQLFNLADRRHLDYQASIGRSFLRDIAVVDVARKHVLKKKK